MIAILLVLIAGIMAVAQAHGVSFIATRESRMLEIGPFFAKAIGSTLGSGIAVIFRPGGDTRHKLISRFFIGAILGVIAAPVFIDYVEWEHTFDFWLASACFCGLVGYLMLEVLYSQEAWDFIKQRLRKRADK